MDWIEYHSTELFWVCCFQYHRQPSSHLMNRSISREDCRTLLHIPFHLQNHIRIRRVSIPHLMIALMSVTCCEVLLYCCICAVFLKREMSIPWRVIFRIKLLSQSLTKSVPVCWSSAIPESPLKLAFMPSPLLLPFPPLPANTLTAPGEGGEFHQKV